MKTQKTAITAKRITSGFSIVLAVFAGTAIAADFNPQPDPPGKESRSDFNFKAAHNPPGFKSAKQDKTHTATPAVQKADQTKKLDIPKVGISQGINH